ncbi:MAG: leucine-rich repeat protein [Clostridium sp.]|nr:leucine-rich repeat protein [Clostridium sp.]MCM1458816.1 leucine-rich repeat protein [Bacteroides sp.]
MDVKRKYIKKQSGMARELKRIISLVLTAVMLVTLAPPTIFGVLDVKAAGTYNAQAAANYALQYTDASGTDDTGSYNKAYSYYAGNDCANFVSQCLVAGGLQTDSTWYKYSQSWNRADYLYEWFKGKAEYKNLIVKNPSASQVKIGDPIFYVWGTEDLSKTNPNDIDHAGICTGYDSNGNPLVSAHSSNRKNFSSWKMGAGAVYVVRLDQVNVNIPPIGHFDLAESTEPQKIKVAGWAFDPDEPSKSIDVKICIGGLQGEAGTEEIILHTNLLRSDANKMYGISGNHGFETTISVKKTGSQPIYLYAINHPSGNNPKLGGDKTVTIISDAVESHTHTWTKQVVSQATCDKAGSNLYTCKGCGSTYTENVQALGHTYTNYSYNNDATCINDGTATATCATCRKLNTVTLKNSATGVHTWNQGTVTKNPTTTETGSKLYVCSVCGETKEEVLPVKISTETPKEPTPQKPAITVTVPKVGETFKDAKSKAKYKITGKQTVSLIKTTATSGKVTIPATVTYKGKTFKVTAIYKGAFRNKTGITAVTFGKNITSVGSEAFSGCKKLKTVTLNKNLIKIGNKAFYKCTALTAVAIPSKVKRIGKQAFYGCKKLKNITIKTTKLKSSNVGSNAFKGINAKATIKVPRSKKAAYKKLLKRKGAGKNARYK